jgi:hypothetical protein
LDHHKQNLLRNSFIPEEEESFNLESSNNQTKSVEPEVINNLNRQTTAISMSPPFAELTSIDLANNKVNYFCGAFNSTEDAQIITQLNKISKSMRT